MNGKQECEHKAKLEKVPDRMVQELMIGWTAGGGMLEILRIEVNTCESQVMCPSNKQDWSDGASAIVVQV